MRLLLGIAYDGTNYHGWQAQSGLDTIQLQVECALSKIANHPVKITCAGRTDKGVHALEQVVHFDTTVKRPLHAWTLGVNTHLPRDIRILWSKAVPDTFHARFSAIARCYRYIIYNAPIPSPVLRDTVSHYYQSLSVERMHEGAQYLRGEHDFSSFRGANCQAKSPVRNIEYINCYRRDTLIILDVKANAFLHHMVRNIVGSLLFVGEGKCSPEWMEQLLCLQDRSQGGPTAKPHGLYLKKVIY